MKRYPLPLPASRALLKLGQDLALLRRRRKYSQASLAERSGIGLNTLKRLEKGEPSGSLAHLARILCVLGEVQRLEQLLDTGADELGLLLMNEELPKRIRKKRQPKAAM